MTIVIDSDNYRASNIETLFFPGGEPHAKLPFFKERVVLFLKARTWNDVGIGACVWDALKRQWEQHSMMGAGVSMRPVLFMPYSPGARQDRSDGTAPLTKSIVASMFATNWGINVFDLHSDQHAYNWRPANWMPDDLRLPQRPDVDFVIAPDKGAAERARLFMEAYCPNAQLLCATKERDPVSGRLSNYDLPFFGAGMSAFRALVVDDICDGGGTFNLLAEAVYKQHLRGSFDLQLFVSHGIFSKGLTDLRQHYSHFYTTDSFCNLLPQPDVTVHSLEHILELLK